MPPAYVSSWPSCVWSLRLDLVLDYELAAMRQVDADKIERERPDRVLSPLKLDVQPIERIAEDVNIR
jgi:hypothetical protein